MRRGVAWGVCADVVDPANVLTTAPTIAVELAQGPTVAYAESKRRLLPLTGTLDEGVQLGDHLGRAAADVPILISAFGRKGEQVTKDVDAGCAMPGGEAWAAQIEKTLESGRHSPSNPTALMSSASSRT